MKASSSSSSSSAFSGAAPARRPPDPARTRSLWVLVGAVVVVTLLPHVPLVSLLVRPLVWLSTMAHEAGHGVGALLVGGRFVSLAIYPDASGVAASSWDQGVVSHGAVVALAGLLGPAVAAVACLWMGISARLARVALVVMGLGCAALLLVTTGFGTVVAVGFALTFVAAGLASSPAWARLWCLVLAVDLGGAVFSRADYLFVTEATTGGGTMPSDVQQVATALGGHHLLWGVAIGAVSVLLLALGLVGFFVGDEGLHRLSLRWERRRQRRTVPTATRS
jgi:hypothetical protein